MGMPSASEKGVLGCCCLRFPSRISYGMYGCARMHTHTAPPLLPLPACHGESDFTWLPSLRQHLIVHHCLGQGNRPWNAGRFSVCVSSVGAQGFQMCALHTWAFTWMPSGSHSKLFIHGAVSLAVLAHVGGSGQFLPHLGTSSHSAQNRPLLPGMHPAS